MVKHNIKCWLWKMLWGLGLVSLVLAWFSLAQGEIAELDTATWFWNALVLGVLSISIKLDCHVCPGCQAGS